MARFSLKLINDIIRTAKILGCSVEPVTNVKNGIEMKGFMVDTGDAGSSRTRPIVYQADLERILPKNATALQYAEKIIEIAKDQQNVTIDPEKYLTREYLEEHLMIGVQKESSEELIKDETEFDEIEQYIFADGQLEKDRKISIKMSEKLLNDAGISEEEAWTIARNNLERRATVQTMAQVMARLMGMPEEMMTDDLRCIYVMTIDSQYKGAGAVLCRSLFKKIAERENCEKFIVLPSSIHEVIVLPCRGDDGLDDMSDMVRQINSAEVLPQDRLVDRAYIVDIA